MNELLKTLKKLSNDREIYIVGGWLRDRLLGRPNRDLDIVMQGDPQPYARAVAKALKGTFVKLDEVNRIYRVVLKNRPELDYIDLARLKGATIREDLGNRDFTINAMALAVTGSEPDMTKIIDPLAGRRDLSKGIVRVASPRSFADDPLRLLRAFRFASVLGFRIEPATRRRIKKEVGLISESAVERVREELFRILATHDAAAWIKELDSTGLLERIFPEIVTMKRSAKKFYFHPHGLWQHSLETLIGIEAILPRLNTYFPGNGDKVRQHLAEPLSSGVTRERLLKLIALLHDVAKPSCAQRDGKKMRFIGHESRGAEMTAEIFRRLRLSRKEIRIARNVIAQHMRPASLTQARMLTRRAAARFFRDLGDDALDLLLLALADWHSYKRLKTHAPALLKRQETALEQLVRNYFAEKEKPVRPKLIDGNMIMKKFGLEPGPWIGALLKAVIDGQDSGTVTTEETALACVKKQLTPIKKRYKIK
jgi:poly(A) polymerase